MKKEINEFMTEHGCDFRTILHVGAFIAMEAIFVMGIAGGIIYITTN